eukprot:CAMPEP_0118833452 /NCGR_PEP_ID=MMETSP1162-20130426/44729_1 /TAXON_ID=33656 /ORGANISM="Phaeocystis Sp, Strain CCMP2710" /LENGTH=96 /DNA_ID=CAMNT_0006765119 /DNA_START=22 /DNA_END=312 /DNA_ORIENTATION=-
MASRSRVCDDTVVAEHPHRVVHCHPHAVVCTLALSLAQVLDADACPVRTLGLLGTLGRLLWHGQGCRLAGGAIEHVVGEQATRGDRRATAQQRRGP